MNIFDLIKHGFRALESGKTLRNVEAWKNVQVVGSLLAALLGIAASFGYNFGLTDQQVYGLAAGIAAIVNGYLTIATTDKIGIGKTNEINSNSVELPAIELQSIPNTSGTTADTGLPRVATVATVATARFPEPKDFESKPIVLQPGGGIQEKDGTDAGWNG